MCGRFAQGGNADKVVGFHAASFDCWWYGFGSWIFLAGEDERPIPQEADPDILRVPRHAECWRRCGPTLQLTPRSQASHTKRRFRRRSGQWSPFPHRRRHSSRPGAFLPTNQPACQYSHVREHNHPEIPWLHAQRSCRHCRKSNPNAKMPFLANELYPVHRRQCRSCAHGSQNHRPGRHAPPAATEEPHGLRQPKQK